VCSKLESTDGASGIRDPRRTTAALRATLQRAGGAAADVEIDPAAATVVHSSSHAAAVAASNGAAQSASAGDSLPDDDVLDADVSALPVRLPPMSARIAQLQAQIRANKELRLELERRAREGDRGDSSNSSSGNSNL